MRTLTPSLLLIPAMLATAGAQQPPPPVPAPYAGGANQGYDPSLAPPVAGEPLDYDAYADDESGEYDLTADVTYDDGYDPSAYTQFQSALEPYGDWVDAPGYGRVWAPSVATVGANFSPYATGGHWALTEYGWTWVSDYDWGWAPFHYGRWLTVGGYGWCWVPGSLWGPGWVSWRYGGGYAGWAPLGPRGARIASPVSTHIGAPSSWHFTVATQLGALHPSLVAPAAVRQIFGRTSAITNARTINMGATSVRFNAGPHPALIAAAVGHAIAPASIAAVAQRALPRTTIVAHAGVPMAAHPFTPLRQSPAIALHPQVSAPRPTYSAPRPAWTAARPSYSAPSYAATRPTYSAPRPIYSVPSYASRPAYTTPRPTYSAPSYNTYASRPSYSAPSYSAPSYHASAPSFSAPSYHSAPSFSGGGSHFSGGGGGHFGGGGGGHHR